MQMPLTNSEAANKPTRKFCLSDLLVHALVMELEAMQSYKELAELMEQSGNTEVAKIFAQMSEIEAKHAMSIDEQLSDFQLPQLTPWDYRWRGLEAPENINRARLNSLMTPHQVLSLALDNEKRAYKFFTDVVDDSTDERVRELAADLAVEEEQHVAWMEEWLAEALASH
jgi:rubrerythrin